MTGSDFGGKLPQDRIAGEAVVDNTFSVPREPEHTPIAKLWELAWKDDRVTCAVYRLDGGLQLRLESPTATILSEPFDLQPRMVARSQALRNSLKRRGWRDPAE